jgi:hypothetical protein
VEQRLREHRRDLEKGRCINPALQTTWDTTNHEYFIFELVEETAKDDRALHEAENRHIAAAGDLCFNRNAANRWREQQPWSEEELRARAWLIVLAGAMSEMPHDMAISHLKQISTSAQRLVEINGKSTLVNLIRNEHGEWVRPNEE